MSPKRDHTELEVRFTAGLRALALSLLLLLVGIMTIVVTATAFSGRLVADDFVSAAALDTAGFLGAQVDSYLSWSGRYSASFFISVGHLLGPRAAQIVPILTIPTAILLLIFFTSAALHRLNQDHRSASGSAQAAVAAGIVFCVLVEAPALFQVWIWMTGVLTYPLPLLITLAFCVMILRRPAKSSVLWLFPIALLTAGFNETWLAAQLTGSGVLALLAIRQASLRPGVTAYLAGTLLGAIILAAAPGNFVRMTHFEQPSVFMALSSSFREGFEFVIEALRYRPVWLILILSLLSGAGHRLRNFSWKNDLFVAIVSFLLIVSAIFPAQLSMGRLPPWRALFVVHVIICFAAVYAALRISHRLRSLRFREQRLLSAAAILLVLLVAWESVPRSLQRMQRVQTFAEQWDEVDATLRDTPPGQPAVVSAPGMIDGLYFLSTHPGHWANHGVARYYGLTEVRRLPVASKPANE